MLVAVKRLKVDTGAVHPVSGVEQMDQLSICSTRLATLRTRRIVNTIVVFCHRLISGPGQES